MGDPYGVEVTLLQTRDTTIITVAGWAIKRLTIEYLLHRMQ